MDVKAPQTWLTSLASAIVPVLQFNTDSHIDNLYPQVWSLPSGLSSGLPVQGHHHYSRHSFLLPTPQVPHSMDANLMDFTSIISLHMSSPFHCHRCDTSLGFNSLSFLSLFLSNVGTTLISPQPLNLSRRRLSE